LKYLYLDHTKARKSHEIEVQEIKTKLETSESLRAVTETKVQRLEGLLSTLNDGPESICQNLIDSQRRLVVLEVNEQALLRRYTASMQVEQVYQKEVARLKDEVQSLESSARTVIERLMRYKKEAKLTIAELHEQLSESVSRVEYGLLENKLNMYISKTKLLIERERDWIEQKIARDVERSTVNSQAEEIQKLTLNIAEYKSKAEKYEQLLKSVEVKSDGNKWKQQAVNLEVQVEILTLRASMAEDRVISAQASESLIKKQLDSADKLYIDSKEQTLHLQQEFLEFCNKYEVY
jgi:hypothetical protein